MAGSGDIIIVRNNTNEEDTDVFTDEVLSALIDDLGVAGASATLWEQKAARLSEEVDVTEAGASHKFSELFKHAKEMAAFWGAKVTAEVFVTEGRVRVKVINRQ